MVATDLTPWSQCVQVLLPVSSVMDVVNGVEEEFEEKEVEEELYVGGTVL